MAIETDAEKRNQALDERARALLKTDDAAAEQNARLLQMGTAYVAFANKLDALAAASTERTYAHKALKEALLWAQVAVATAPAQTSKGD